MIAIHERFRVVCGEVDEFINVEADDEDTFISIIFGLGLGFTWYEACKFL